MNIPTSRICTVFVLCAFLALAACTPTFQATQVPAITKTSTVVSLPPPQAVELGVLGKGSAQDMAWSPDGNLLVVTSTVGVYIYDTQTWQVVKTIAKEQFGDKRGESIVFTPDQKSLIMLLYEYPASSFWRYDLQTEQATPWFADLTLRPQNLPVFSPNGKTFAFLNQICENTENDKQNCINVLELRDSAAGNLLTTIRLQTKTQSQIFVFSPDGNQLAVTDQISHVTLWDVASGKLHHEFLHDSIVSSLTFSADSQVLASASRDASVRFWDVQTGQNLFVLREFTQGLQYVAYQGHEKKILVGQLYDNDIYQYALDEHHLPTHRLPDVMQPGKVLASQTRYANDIRSETIRLSPATNKVAVLLNNNVQIWDVETGKRSLVLPEYTSYIDRLKFSIDSDLLAATDYNVHLWQVSTQKFIATLPINAYYINDISFRPNSHQIAVIGTSPDIQIWDTLSYQKVQDIVDHNDLCAGGFSFAAFSPNGMVLATAGYCGVMIWDAESGEFLQKLDADNSGSPYELTFSTDGQDLIYVAQRGIWRWHLATGEIVYFTEIPKVENDYWQVAISASQIMIERRPAGIFQFFDLQTGKHLHDFATGQNEYAIALHPRGRLFAHADYSNIFLTDSISGANLLPIKFNPRAIFFSPDTTSRKLLAASTYDSTIHLWDVTSAVKFVEATVPRTATPNPALIPTSTMTPAPMHLPIMPLTPPSLGPGAIRPETIAQLEKRSELGLGDPRSVIWAADGKTLAISTVSGIHIFKIDSPRPIRFLPVDSALMKIAFSADGSLLAGQMGNATIQVWEVATGRRLHKLAGIDCFNYGMTFSPDLQTLSADCFDITYHWSLSNGRLLGREKKVLLGKTSSDGSMIAQAGSASATLLDTATNNIIQTFEIPEMAPAQASFTPDGKTLLIWFYKFEIARSGIYVPGQDSKSIIQLWDVLPGQRPVLRTTFIPGNWNVWAGDWMSGIQSLSFSPDSRRVFTFSGDGKTQVWDVSSGKLLATLEDARTSFLAPNGRHLLSTGKTVRIWDILADGQPSLRWSIPGFERVSSTQMFFSAKGDLITATSDTFHFWTQNQGHFTAHPKSIEVSGTPINLFSVSPNGSWLAYSTLEKFVVGKNDLKNQNWQTLKQLTNNPFDLRAIQFSPDSTMLASTDSTNKLLLWRLGEPESKMMKMEPASYISNLLFSPDSKKLLGYNSSSEKSDLYVWDTSTGKLLHNWKTIVDHLTFHPDNITIATSNYHNGTIRLFDLRTWRLLREIKGSSSMYDLVFNPDGSLLVSSYSDRIEFRDFTTGQLVKTLNDNFTYRAFSPDGRFLALGLYDGRVQVWGFPEK